MTDALVRDPGPRWFDSYHLEPETSAEWVIGPFALWARRRASEWRLATWKRGEAEADGVSITVPSAADTPPDGAVLRRFEFQASPAEVELLPALADRPVVASPDAPLMLPPRERITLYVSTPLWLEVRFGLEAPPALDLPLQRPSDTWFGPDTRSGELCYACRTVGRVHLENLPRLPHHAICPVHIRNESSQPLAFERIKIPVPEMSLYAAPDHQLWTQTVTLAHGSSEPDESVHIERRPPSWLAGATPVRDARRPQDRLFLSRALGHLLGS